MRLHSILARLSAFVSVICLGLAYILAGYWLVMLLFLAMALFWIILRKQPSSWPASVLLFAYVLVAAIGIVIDLPVFLIAVGCTTALAWWDLTGFEQAIAGDTASEMNLALEKHHLRSLGLATCTGLALIFTGAYLNVRIPFLVTVLLVLMAMLGLTRLPVRLS